MSDVTIQINGRSYQIACEDDQEDHLRRLAEFVESRLQDVVSTVGQVGQDRLLVMTSLLIADELSTTGNPSIGCYVISMTHSADDVMNVLWLWKTAWLQKTGSMDNLPHLQIVPLFETIDDLRRSADILLDLLQNPTYQEYLSLQEEKSQMVKLGNWALAIH